MASGGNPILLLLVVPLIYWAADKWGDNGGWIAGGIVIAILVLLSLG